ncbi:unknown [Clostridium sp. CAG:813]|nr:unknown [Clostridium sp. CAG:813]
MSSPSLIVVMVFPFSSVVTSLPSEDKLSEVSVVELLSTLMPLFSSGLFDVSKICPFAVEEAEMFGFARCSNPGYTTPFVCISF